MSHRSQPPSVSLGHVVGTLEWTLRADSHAGVQTLIEENSCSSALSDATDTGDDGLATAFFARTVQHSPSELRGAPLKALGGAPVVLQPAEPSEPCASLWVWSGEMASARVLPKPNAISPPTAPPPDGTMTTWACK